MHTVAAGDVHDCMVDPCGSSSSSATSQAAPATDLNANEIAPQPNLPSTCRANCCSTGPSRAKCYSFEPWGRRLCATKRPVFLSCTGTHPRGDHASMCILDSNASSATRVTPAGDSCNASCCAYASPNSAHHEASPARKYGDHRQCITAVVESARAGAGQRCYVTRNFKHCRAPFPGIHALPRKPPCDAFPGLSATQINRSSKG
jgi:hypothetical protein